MEFSYWRDLNSIIADPIFTDYTKRDFTFKKKANVEKIEFKEFDLNYGVIGEEYWLYLDNSKEYNQFHENQILQPTYFYTSGSTDFDKNNDNFLDNCIINQFDSVIGKTNPISYSGLTSLSFSASEKQMNSNARPEFVVPCNY